MKLHCVLMTALMLLSPLAFANAALTKEIQAKLNRLTPYIDNNKDTDQAWQMTVEISHFIAKHPEYDDGTYAASMNDAVVKLLAKPWQYASPYLIGDKSSPEFQAFILTHVNDSSVAKDLLQDRKNVEKNCDVNKYPYCMQLIHKINSSILSN